MNNDLISKLPNGELKALYLEMEVILNATEEGDYELPKVKEIMEQLHKEDFMYSFEDMVDDVFREIAYRFCH